MGTYGAGVFQDDFALDVREAYLELLTHAEAGVSPVEALRAEFSAELDTDDEPVFWIALAAVQWEYGRLEESVRTAALDVIGRGADLPRWTASPDLARRQAVLKRLSTKLQSPQPKRRTPRHRPPVEVPAIKVSSPDGRAVATAYQIAPPGAASGALMQVLVEQDAAGQRGGGGVFVARCPYDHVMVCWLESDTLQVTYPAAAMVERALPQSFFFGRTIRIVYVPRA